MNYCVKIGDFVWVTCVLAFALATSPLCFSQEAQTEVTTEDVEAASMVEAYVLGLTLPQRFDLSIRITSLLDAGNHGIGEEKTVIRWQHDSDSKIDLLGKDTVLKISATKKPQPLISSLGVYFNSGEKTLFRQRITPHPMPKGIGRLSRGADYFREDAGSPQFDLFGIVPFTTRDFPKTYVERLRSDSFVPRTRSKLVQSNEQVTISLIKPSPIDDGFYRRKWVFQTSSNLPLTTVSRRFSKEGETVFSNGSFSEHYQWGEFQGLLIPIAIEGDCLANRWEFKEKPDDPQIQVEQSYLCELKWHSISTNDVTVSHCHQVLSNDEALVNYLDFDKQKTEASVLPGF
jgi:hypothetical protein